MSLAPRRRAQTPARVICSASRRKFQILPLHNVFAPWILYFTTITLLRAWTKAIATMATRFAWDNFRYGESATITVGPACPPPEDYVRYTAWHINRALNEFYNARDDRDLVTSSLLTPVFRDFSVSLTDCAWRRPIDV